MKFSEEVSITEFVHGFKMPVWFWFAMLAFLCI